VRNLFISLFALTFVSQAGAQNSPVDFDYQFGYRAEYDSNPTRLNDNEQSDLTHALLFGLDIARAGTNFDLQINGNGDFLTYQDDTFDDEFRLNMSAELLWRIAPERFHWVVRNESGRAPINPRAVVTLENEQQTNLFSTGPDFIFRLNPTDALTVGARYNDLYTDDTDDDADQFAASVRWNRELDSASSLELALTAASTDFDQPLINQDFDRYQLTLGYNTRRFTASQAVNEYRIEGGYSLISFDDREDLDSPVLRAGWRQERPEGTTLFADAEFSLGTAGTTLNDGGRDVASLQVQQNAAVGDPFERLNLGAGFGRQLGRINLGAQADFLELDYDTLDLLDEESWLFGANFDYSLNELMTLGLGLGFEQQDFVSIGQEDDLFDAVLNFTYQRTRRWTYRLSAGWEDRDSSLEELNSDGVVVGFEVIWQR